MAEQYTVHSMDEEWWGDVIGKVEKPPAKIVLAKSVSPQLTYPVPIQATAHGQIFQAELLDDNGRVYYNGMEYGSPSGAGQAATGWKSCNGWSVWRYQHPETGEWRAINELKKK